MLETDSEITIQEIYDKTTSRNDLDDTEKKAKFVQDTYTLQKDVKYIFVKLDRLDYNKPLVMLGFLGDLGSVQQF